MFAGSALAQDTTTVHDSMTIRDSIRSEASTPTQESVPWKDSFYPYITSGDNDFPLFVFHFEERKAADYDARTTYAGLLTADAGASTRGSRFITLTFLAPLLRKDWRLATELTGERDARFGF